MTEPIINALFRNRRFRVRVDGGSPRMRQSHTDFETLEEANAAYDVALAQRVPDQVVSLINLVPVGLESHLLRRHPAHQIVMDEAEIG